MRKKINFNRELRTADPFLATYQTSAVRLLECGFSKSQPI